MDNNKEDEKHISEEEVHSLSELIQSHMYDSVHNPEFAQYEKETEEDQSVPSLYDLAQFGLRSENMEQIICNIAVDILHEIRLNEE